MNSLGFNKSNKDTTVVVAMSGGVDSSVVAALMKEEGYDVTGITLKLYDDTKQSKDGRQCCAGQDILDAKRVSENINIEHKIKLKAVEEKIKENFDLSPAGIKKFLSLDKPIYQHTASYGHFGRTFDKEKGLFSWESLESVDIFKNL